MNKVEKRLLEMAKILQKRYENDRWKGTVIPLVKDDKQIEEADAIPSVQPNPKD